MCVWVRYACGFPIVYENALRFFTEVFIWCSAPYRVGLLSCYCFTAGLLLIYRDLRSLWCGCMVVVCLILYGKNWHGGNYLSHSPNHSETNLSRSLSLALEDLGNPRGGVYVYSRFVKMIKVVWWVWDVKQMNHCMRVLKLVLYPEAIPSSRVSIALRAQNTFGASWKAHGVSVCLLHSCLLWFPSERPSFVRWSQRLKKGNLPWRHEAFQKLFNKQKPIHQSFETQQALSLDNLTRYQIRSVQLLLANRDATQKLGYGTQLRT